VRSVPRSKHRRFPVITPYHRRPSRKSRTYDETDLVLVYSPSTEGNRRHEPNRIVPVGSIEQHGPHLAIEVDAALVEEVAKRAASELHPRVRALVLPTVWMGLAEHHMSFGERLR
jgi:hypothetical protein